MNNFSNDQTAQLLVYLLIGAFVMLFILGMVYIIMKAKDISKRQKSNIEKPQEKEILKSNSKNSEQGKASVFTFMEFDDVQDNMIVQKNGERFLMVVQCQGVNYDLMSGVEKTGVEEGFVQFLNTLRHPIQIYVQTGTINLESSILEYKKRVDEVENRLVTMRQQYHVMLEEDTYSKEELEKVFYEMTKLTNMYEYGRDIIYDTEKMSRNKNILSKKYYLIIPYYSSELGKNEFDKGEVISVAFSELYTRAQAIIRAISSCGVTGKILNSKELVELLYSAYNRDEAEVFGIDRAIRAGYDQYYSTAPDVLDKKMKELDILIEKKAIEKAQESINIAQTNRQKEVLRKEESIEELADEMARILLNENRKYLGNEIIDDAINELDRNISEEGGSEDEKKKTRTRKSNVAKKQ